MSKILVVEDDPNLLSVLTKMLTDERYTVDSVSSAEDARSYLTSVSYDLVILDRHLPDADGLQICMEYRGNGGKAPILFLTGKDTTKDKVTGLEAGADDYLTKPFSTEELISRVRALLRRPPVLHSKTIQARDLVLDPSTHSVTRKGEPIHLYPREFALLELFMLNPARVFSPDEILNRAWPTDKEASIETLRQTILRLREKVETDKKEPLIQTVRGVGYRLNP